MKPNKLKLVIALSLLAVPSLQAQTICNQLICYEIPDDVYSASLTPPTPPKELEVPYISNNGYIAIDWADSADESILDKDKIDSSNKQTNFVQYGGVSIPIESLKVAPTAPITYNLLQQKDGESWLKVQQNLTASNVSLNNQADGEYHYKVEACNSAGCTSSQTSSMTVVNNGIITVPDDGSIDLGSGKNLRPDDTLTRGYNTLNQSYTGSCFNWSHDDMKTVNISRTYGHLEEIKSHYTYKLKRSIGFNIDIGEQGDNIYASINVPELVNNETEIRKNHDFVYVWEKIYEENFVAAADLTLNDDVRMQLDPVLLDEYPGDAGEIRADAKREFHKKCGDKYVNAVYLSNRIELMFHIGYKKSTKLQRTKIKAAIDGIVNQIKLGGKFNYDKEVDEMFMDHEVSLTLNMVGGPDKFVLPQLNLDMISAIGAMDEIRNNMTRENAVVTDVHLADYAKPIYTDPVTNVDYLGEMPNYSDLIVQQNHWKIIEGEHIDRCQYFTDVEYDRQGSVNYEQRCKDTKGLLKREVQRCTENSMWTGCRSYQDAVSSYYGNIFDYLNDTIYLLKPVQTELKFADGSYDNNIHAYQPPGPVFFPLTTNTKCGGSDMYAACLVGSDSVLDYRQSWADENPIKGNVARLGLNIEVTAWSQADKASVEFTKSRNENGELCMQTLYKVCAFTNTFDFWPGEYKGRNELFGVKAVRHDFTVVE